MLLMQFNGQHFTTQLGLMLTLKSVASERCKERISGKWGHATYGSNNYGQADVAKVLIQNGCGKTVYRHDILIGRSNRFAVVPGIS